MKITHLKVFHTTLRGTRHPSILEIQKEAHDFPFELSLDLQRLNTDQFLAKLENVFTLTAATLTLHAYRREVARPFNKNGTGCRISWKCPEQSQLLRSLPANPVTRAVLVEGASHFSPVRVEGQSGSGQGEDVFQLGEELVGVQPLQVQAQLEREIVRFLMDLENGRVSASAQGGVEHLQVGDLHLHRLDQTGAARFLD